MIRKFSIALRRFTRDQQGNNLIAYALIIGAIGIAGAGYLANVSASLKAGLNNQGAKLAQTAGTTWQTPSSSTVSPSSPTSAPTSGAPTAGSGSGGSGSSGSGNNGSGNNGNGNNGNGNNGKGNGGAGNGNGKGNKK